MLKSDELTVKIEALTAQLEQAKEEYHAALCAESGIEPGKTIVKGQDGALYCVTTVKKYSEFTNIIGKKKLKNGDFSDRETYIGILGYHGTEIVNA